MAYFQNAIVEWGLAGALLAMMLYFVFRMGKNSLKAQAHDGAMSDQTALQYRRLIETLQDQLKFANEQSVDTMKAYKAFVQESIINRLDHCEEQHKSSEARLTEAHKRLDSANELISDLGSQLASFKSSIATAAIAIAPSTIK